MSDISFTGSRIEELVGFVTRMPAKDADDMTGKKLPFVAHEILKSGCQIVSEFFLGSNQVKSSMMSSVFDHDSDTNNETMQSEAKDTAQGINKAALEHLFKNFYSSEACNDPVLGGYVKEIIVSLVAKSKS